MSERQDHLFRRQDGENTNSTHWSLVLAAGNADSSKAQESLAKLCNIYWYPLYAYVRRRVTSVDEAQDLTQAFFAQLLSKNYLAAARPERGRFRSFLLSALRHFLANEWNKANAQKRGGGRVLLSLDFSHAESRLALATADQQTPERLFDQQWAVTLINDVMKQLRNEFVATGKQRAFDILKDYLAGVPQGRSYAVAAAELQLAEGAVRVAAHRLRQRYGDILRQKIRETVATEAEVNEEIQSLFRVFDSP